MTVQTRRDLGPPSAKPSENRVSDLVSDRVYTRISKGPSRYMAAKPIARFVPDLTKKAFQKYGFASAAIVADWTEIVGAQIAERCQPEKLNWPRGTRKDSAESEEETGFAGATLILKTDAAYALDIQYASAQIVERINAYFGYAAVRTLKIVQGPLPSSVTSARSATPSPAKAPIRADDVAQECRSKIGDIEDDALKAALSRLARSVFSNP